MTIMNTDPMLTTFFARKSREDLLHMVEQPRRYFENNEYGAAAHSAAIIELRARVDRVLDYYGTECSFTDRAAAALGV